VLLAFAALFLPRLAFASPVGLCDERGLSAIAPLPVLPVGDASLDADDQGQGPRCEVDATAGCRIERGNQSPPHFVTFFDLEPTLGSNLPQALPAPVQRAVWPDPAEAFVPPGWRRRVEHPPRALPPKLAPKTPVGAPFRPATPSVLRRGRRAASSCPRTPLD
jgi:hypothetical protein